MNQGIVLAIIGVLAAAFVFLPLVRGRREASASRPQRSSPLARGVAASLAPEELAELELDRAMGRVSEADYRRWRGQVEAGLAPDEAPASDTSSPAGATARAEALVSQWREAPRPECPRCGERPEPEARYCSNCGTSLRG